MKPEDMVTVFTRYFLKKDLRGILSLYDKNAVYYFPPDDIRAIGKAKIKSTWKKWFDRYTPVKFHLKVQSVHYDAHNKRYATVRARGHSIVTDDVQKRQIRTQLQSLDIIWQRHDGKWVYLVDFC